MGPPISKQVKTGNESRAAVQEAAETVSDNCPGIVENSPLAVQLVCQDVIRITAILCYFDNSSIEINKAFLLFVKFTDLINLHYFIGDIKIYKLRLYHNYIFPIITFFNCIPYILLSFVNDLFTYRYYAEIHEG